MGGFFLNFDRRSPGSRGVHRPWGNRLVQVDVSVPYLEVETAWGIYADPSLEVHCCSLPAIVRQWDQVPNIAFQAFGYSHFAHKYHLPHWLLR